MAVPIVRTDDEARKQSNLLRGFGEGVRCGADSFAVAGYFEQMEGVSTIFLRGSALQDCEIVRCLGITALG